MYIYKYLLTLYWGDEVLQLGVELLHGGADGSLVTLHLHQAQQTHSWQENGINQSYLKYTDLTP